MEGADWKHAVELMRASPAAMGIEPSNAGRLLLRLGAAQLGHMVQLRRALGVTMSELSALMALWDGGRCSMSELGKRIGLSRAAMTTLADRVERGGYLERSPDTEDRRRTLLGVTPKWEQQLFRHAAGLTSGASELAGSASSWDASARDMADLRELVRCDTARLFAAGTERIDRLTPSLTADDPSSYW